MSVAKPSLFVVATPIGNLDDLSPRAAKTLAHVDIIAAEDTRVARKLLSHLNITGKELLSYHDHSDGDQAQRMIDRMLRENKSMALISDAGTPCISDPGYGLVRLARESGMNVHPIAGPSSVTALLSVAGLATDRFAFVGFIPAKKSQLATELERWAVMGGTIVFFESLRRLPTSIEAIAAAFPHARLAIGRELTKLFEETVVMPVTEAAEWLAAHRALKGEAVLAIELGDASAAPTIDQASLEGKARKAFARGATLKELLLEYKDAGIPHKVLYQILLRAKS